jgi:hypothetical protein
MGRPTHTSAAMFTSREIALAANLQPRSMALLIDQDLAPEAVNQSSGKSGHRTYDSAAVAHAALLGCLHAAGFELLVSARLAAAFADDYGASYGRLPANLKTFLYPPLNTGGGYPWGKMPDDPELDFEQDYWLHHLLRNRSAVYRRAMAQRGDFVIEIADHQFVVTRILGLDNIKMHSPVTKGGLPVSPEYRLVGRGPSSRIVPIHMEVDSLDFSVDPKSAERMRELERDYLDGRKDAVTTVQINLSLGIRNAFDRIQDDRETRAAA